MANLPRFGRAWQRTSSGAHPAPAAAQPPTTKSLQPIEPNPPPVATPPSSPPREFTPRISSPEVERKTDKYKKPAKPERRTEYGSGKPPQKAEAINLNGHNVGAIMEVKQFSDKISGGEVIKKFETETGVHHGNDDGKTGGKEKSRRATGFPMTQFMNSNFQDVNNSVMYNSSCSGRDPGLHLGFSGKSKDDGAIADGGEKSKY